MKILLCAHRFLPRFVGGVEVYTLRLAQTLQGLGHDVQLVTGEPGDRPDNALVMTEEVFEGIPLRRLAFDFRRRPSRHGLIGYDQDMAAKLAGAIEKWSPDFVHAITLSALTGTVMRIAKRSGFPVVFTAADFAPICVRGTLLQDGEKLCDGREESHKCARCLAQDDPLFARVYEMIDHLPQPLLRAAAHIGEWLRPNLISGSILDMPQRWTTLRPFLKQLDLIIAPSTAMRDMLVLNGVDPKRIVISVYGICPPPSPLPTKQPAPHVRFAFIGRIAYEKGVDLLVRAFDSLPSGDRAKLTLYGVPERRAYAENIQKITAGNPNIILAGHLDNAEVYDTYRQIDVLVTPSIWYENSPITILEAYANRTPVISSDIPGVADLVNHEVNGLLFKRGDPLELARQMERCIEEPELLPRLSTGIRPIKTIYEDAVGLVELYRQIERRTPGV
ncbi:MAG: glycosyltransferase family 4 protein [Anaerolineae bacterium]